MDTSEQNIKQCGKAGEIQVGWIPQDWDYCYCYGNKEVVVLSGYETDGGYYGHYIDGDYSEGKWINARVGGCDNKHTWLPTQAQLQKMVGLRIDALWNKFVEFAGYARDANEWLSPQYKSYSWEQLWLAFCMSEKFNKRWDGENWKNESKSSEED